MKKRPLVILNGPLTKKNDAIFVNHQTGNIIAELAELAGEIEIFQYLVDHKDLDSIGGLSNFNLLDTPNLFAHGHPYRIRKKFLRKWDNICFYSKLMVRIKASAWVYIFYPGRLPAFTAWFCKKIGLNYGVYVRGPVDNNSSKDQFVIENARIVICNNTHTANQIADLNPQIKVARPVLTFSRQDLVRKKHFSKDLKTELLFVGRVTREKGIEELYTALNELAVNGYDFHLNIIGNGPLAAKEFLPFAIKEKVSFAGFISDHDKLAEFYKQADIFVLPTHFEAFPRVLYEAMTWGLSIVTTFVNGIPALMSENQNCLRIEAHQAASISRKLQKLFEDPELMQKTSAGGIATMEKFFNNLPDSNAELLYKGIQSK
jgi:glycosyltransferase involved in cell wall biosynthesis